MSAKDFVQTQQIDLFRRWCHKAVTWSLLGKQAQEEQHF